MTEDEHAITKCAAELCQIFEKYGVEVDVMIFKNPITRKYSVNIQPRKES